MSRGRGRCIHHDRRLRTDDASNSAIHENERNKTQYEQSHLRPFRDFPTVIRWGFTGSVEDSCMHSSCRSVFVPLSGFLDARARNLCTLESRDATDAHQGLALALALADPYLSSLVLGMGLGPTRVRPKPIPRSRSWKRRTFTTGHEGSCEN